MNGNGNPGPQHGYQKIMDWTERYREQQDKLDLSKRNYLATSQLQSRSKPRGLDPHITSSDRPIPPPSQPTVELHDLRPLITKQSYVGLQDYQLRLQQRELRSMQKLNHELSKKLVEAKDGMTEKKKKKNENQEEKIAKPKKEAKSASNERLMIRLPDQGRVDKS